MKYTLVLFVSTLLFNTYLTNLCSASLKDIEQKHKEILEGKSIESLAENGELSSLGNKKLIKLHLKANVNLLITPKTEEIQKSFSILKKLTNSYTKNEFKPFTYFIDCFIIDEKDEIILLFGNLGMSLENSALGKKLENMDIKKKFLLGSEIFKIISKLGSFNPQLQFNMSDPGSSMFFLEMEDNTLQPIFNIFTGNLYDTDFEIEKKYMFAAPENLEESKHYFSSMIWGSFMLSTVLTNGVNEKINDKSYFDGQYLGFMSKINEKESYDLLLNGLVRIIDDLDIQFNQPNAFTKFGRWFLSLFTDQRVQRSYNFQDLIRSVLTFSKNNRPAAQNISDKFLYFSQNMIENQNSSGNSIIL